MPMEMGEKKHAYGGRQCMACGGMACKISYEQLRDMVEKKQNGDFMAKGGEVESLHHSPAGGSANRAKSAARYRNEEGQSGVHPSTSIYRPGESHAGSMLRSGNPEHAKAAHRSNLEEVRSMPKPHGKFADGGEVGPSGFPVIHPVRSAQQQQQDAQVLAIKKADGGEIESPDSDMGDDDMLMDQCADECMAAMKSGDKKAFKDALSAMVASLMHESSEK